VVERQSVHFQAMPEEDRGVLLVIFLANALIVTFLNAVLVGLVARAIYQGWRSSLSWLSLVRNRAGSADRVEGVADVG
jgi:hypothetical protein